MHGLCYKKKNNQRHTDCCAFDCNKRGAECGLQCFVVQAQRLQKEEVRQRQQVQNGEDVQMKGTKSTRNERKKRKRQSRDVDMADAEV